MKDSPHLPDGSAMERIFGSEHPGDALLYLRDITAYLAATFEWSQLEANVTMTKHEAAGLHHILQILERGIQEVYDAT